MPSTVRTARTPTDLNSDIIRIEKRKEKRNDERADRRKGGQRIKYLYHREASNRIVGRPRTECAIPSILDEPATIELNR